MGAMPLHALPVAAAAAWLLVLGGATSPAADAPPAAGELRAEDAVTAILRAFEKRPLVGIGELHGNADVHELIRKLLEDRRFTSVVNDLVVEFGNVLYQPIIDRYIDGGDVPLERLREAWRNTVNPLTWDSPVYEEFYRAVRQANGSLPPGKRLRVVLGDVPVDWPHVQKMADLGPLGSRDVHFADVVEREVMRKGRKAFLIAGQWHLYRRNPAVEDLSQVPEDERNAAEILLKKHPDSLLVIQPADFGRGAKTYEPRLAALEKGSIAEVKGTWLGQLGFGEVTPFPDKLRYVNGKPVDLGPLEPFTWPRVEEVLDAYLLLGPKKALRWRKPLPETYAESAYLEELRRRARLMGYPPGHFQLMTGQRL
jgi:hypothetical protein